MQKEFQNDLIKEFIETCQAHHLKITPQRIGIFRELIKSKTHPTADMMYQIVKKEFPNISYDTVNRTLLTFAEVGIVEVVEVFGGAKRFDTDITNHHHLHCISCGKIIDFFNNAYDHLDVPEEIGKNFTVVGKRVVLKGICKECSLNKTY